MVKYGFHGIHALTCVLFEEEEREYKDTLFRDYVGQSLWHITTIQHLKTRYENDMPQYVDLSHPEKASKETAEEVKQKILSKLE